MARQSGQSWQVWNWGPFMQWNSAGISVPIMRDDWKPGWARKERMQKDSMVQRTFSPIGRNIYSVHHSFSFSICLESTCNQALFTRNSRLQRRKHLTLPLLIKVVLSLIAQPNMLNAPWCWGCCEKLDCRLVSKFKGPSSVIITRGSIVKGVWHIQGGDVRLTQVQPAMLWSLCLWIGIKASRVNSVLLCKS